MAGLEVLRDRRVLVTGDTGFKGSWLALCLRDLGALVTGFALPPAGSRAHFTLLGLDRLIHHIDGDIRDFDQVRAVVDAVRPEVVFHLAAQALVRRSYAEPKLTFDTNVGGFINVLEALRDVPGLRAAVFVTSDKCYFNKEWVWGYRENDELGGHDPYSASKAAAELVFQAYARSYFTRRPEVGLASARAGNVIGGGDWAAHRLIPDCVRALGAGEPIVLRSPGATRPWQHVLEPVFGYQRLAAGLLEEPQRLSGSWNFGPEVTAVRTVLEVVKAVIRHWGSGELRVEAPAEALHEAGLLQLNVDKAKLDLGWRPKWDAERAIAETVAWYRGVLDGRPAMEMTRAQIRSYQGRLREAP